MSEASLSNEHKSRYNIKFVEIIVGICGLIIIFLPECRAAVKVWVDSTAYGHCFLVGPIVAYLLWERRDVIRNTPAQRSPILLPIGIVLLVLWLAADRLGLMEGRQLVALGFVELLLITSIGIKLYIALLGPLLYLVFLVPFGAFITPVLQSFTAWFIDIGLTFLGIPHFVNEMVIEISAGTFFVAEACAGLRFLIAAVAFGVFYSLLNYRSSGRRAFFILLSILVPIIANGVRALGIVVLGHVLGSAEAAAADHIIYGWVFFSFVMILLVLIGMPLREEPAQASIEAFSVYPMNQRHAWTAVAVLVLAGIGPLAAEIIDRNVSPPNFAGVLELAAPQGCRLADRQTTPSQVEAVFACGERRWNFVAQLAPARSTASALSEARSRLTGFLGAEDVSIAPLRKVSSDVGNWQILVSREPEIVNATAVWIHGQVAPGGLKQRLIQARDSVFGNDIPPLLMSITNKPSRSFSEIELEEMIAELRGILQAQPLLSDMAAYLTGATKMP